MLSVLICFQHTTTIIRVNPSKNNSTESQNLPAIPQITPTINSNFPSTAKAQPPKRVYPLYLWPRSKVWMRALKASIQTAATKVTNIGVRLSSEASLCLRQIPIYYIPEDYSSANSMYPGTYPLMFSESSIQESSLPFLHLPRILEDHQLFCHQSHT